jgi:ribosomal protein L7/L12
MARCETKSTRCWTSHQQMIILELGPGTTGFRTEFGITAAAPVAVAAPSRGSPREGGGSRPQREEKTEFTVVPATWREQDQRHQGCAR